MKFYLIAVAVCLAQVVYGEDEAVASAAAEASAKAEVELAPVALIPAPAAADAQAAAPVSEDTSPQVDAFLENLTSYATQVASTCTKAIDTASTLSFLASRAVRGLSDIASTVADQASTAASSISEAASSAGAAAQANAAAAADAKVAAGPVVVSADAQASASALAGAITPPRRHLPEDNSFTCGNHGYTGPSKKCAVVCVAKGANGGKCDKGTCTCIYS